MFNIVKKEIDWNGKKLSIETGKIARQADGAVILRSGDTVILATAVAAKKANPETDFFPLTVNYQESTPSPWLDRRSSRRKDRLFRALEFCSWWFRAS